MASANAMAKIDCTIIFVDALGLRPTAIEAPSPIRPTPTAAPKAARPTCMFPVIVLSLLIRLHYTAGSHFQIIEIHLSIVPSSGFFLPVAHQKCKNRCQQHEDHRLHESHQQLEEVKRNWQQPAKTGNQIRHGVQHVLSGKDVAVETKGQGDRSNQYRDDLQTARCKEYQKHRPLQETRGLTLRPKQLLEKPPETDLAKRPKKPKAKKHKRHCQSHVDVRVSPAEERLIDLEAVRSLVSPTNRAYTRNQPDPVGGENENEDGREKPERAVG